MPVVFSAAARPNSEIANDNVLIFVGSARRHLRLNDSINAALRDAARKVAFFYSVSGEIVTHESSGALVGNTFVAHSEITDSDDYVQYLDKLEYNSKTDVFEADNTVFVHAAYRSTVKITVDYAPVRNKEQPWWIDNPPSKIGPYLAGVGFSAARLYHNDAIVASYENAIFSLIELSATKIRIIESGSGGSNNMTSLSISSGTLTGFFVLDTWTDPITKSVWTLAIAGRFTENKTMPDNSVSNDFSNTSLPYQYIPVQFFPGPPIFEDWTTHKPRDTETTLYFWGFSGKCKDRREAETMALQDAKLRVSGYIWVSVESNGMMASRYQSERGHITQDSEIFNTSSLSYTQNILEGIEQIRSQSEHHSDGSIEIQILVSVSRDAVVKIQDETDQRMMNLSSYYTSEIKNQTGSNLEILRKYEQIISQLSSPLERARVKFLGLAEAVNLYDYLTGQIKKLSAEIVIAPGKKDYFYGTWAATVENGKSFDTYEITFSSDGRSCTVRIKNGMSEQIATGSWSLNDDIFKLEAVFRNPPRKIDWKYYVKYDGSNSFIIIGRAATDGPMVRFTFFRQSYY